MNPSTQSAYCTTREAAELLGVSLTTAQLWVESGLLDAWKTEGGHRRIHRTSVQRLLDGEVKPKQGAAAPARQGERLKVRVVEDNNDLLKLYKAAIGNWNLPIDTLTAGNGVDGLIRVGRDTPDLMITDLAMPGLDGYQLINSLATTSYREGMDIVVVSGLDPAEIEARGGIPKGIRIFSKPVPFDQLRAICAGMIERRTPHLYPSSFKEEGQPPHSDAQPDAQPAPVTP